MSSSEIEEKAAAGVERMELSDTSEQARNLASTGMSDTTDEARNLAATGDGDQDMEGQTTTNDEKEATEKGEEQQQQQENSNDDDDDISTTTDSDNSDVFVEPNKADDMLIRAANHKEEGNGHFKKGDMAEAARSYRRGCSALKGLNKNNTGDEQVKALLVTLQTNLSMVCFKQNKFKMSASVASKALKTDGTNVKALYRRAVAYRKVGEWDKARCDLREAMKLDPSNSACKKEFASVKKELEQSKQSQKKALAKAFSSKTGPSFLYNDKEEEKKRKEAEEERKKEQEKELLKKRKAEWEDECVHRMARNEPAISFDDWDKERKAEEKKRKKEEDKRKKEEEQRRKEERKKARAAARANQQSPSNGSDSEDELTEQELAMMRGYKKTSDGRTTSYFTREISESEKMAIGCIKPKRLDVQAAGSATGGCSTPPGVVPPSGTDPAGSSRPSAWNQAGTWEEKDTTAWCKSQLRKRLEETSVTGKLDAEVTAVSELTGDASVAIAGTKKRYIFDFHVKLDYEIKNLENKDEVVASGVVRLPDICSGSHEELEVIFDSWKKRPAKEFETEATNVRSCLVQELRDNVHHWVRDFNEMY